MPNTITPDDDVAATSAVAAMRRHITQKLATVTADLPPLPEPLHRALANAVPVSCLALSSLPEPIRQRMLEDAERIKVMAANAEYFCFRDGHRLIPDTDDLFVCSICTKRFRLVD